MKKQHKTTTQHLQNIILEQKHTIKQQQSSTSP